MLRLSDIMTTDVITVNPEMTLRETMELFSKHHISGAPVVTGNKTVGVISAADIVAFSTNPPDEPADHEDPPNLVDHERGDEEWKPLSARSTNYFGEGWLEVVNEDSDDQPPGNSDLLDRYTVSEAMTWGVYSLPPTSDVVAAAECMRSAGIHRMLIMKDGKLLGLVTTMDLVHAVAKKRIVRRTYVFDSKRGRAPE